eukprot:Nitzschia sp. Nitz4//scaffold65_size103378//77649//79196//NITZ4_004478-RA/size103378-processed-gene-0.150-mRNA-1//-1//CDS//3329556276//6922//frame0
MENLTTTTWERQPKRRAGPRLAEQPPKKVHQDVLFRLPPPQGMPPCPKIPNMMPLMPMLEEDDQSVVPTSPPFLSPPVGPPLVLETPYKKVAPLQVPPRLLQHKDSPRMWNLQNTFSPIVRRTNKTVRKGINHIKSNSIDQDVVTSSCSTPLVSAVSQRVTPTEEIIKSRLVVEDETPTPPPVVLPESVFLPSDLEQEAASLLVSLKTLPRVLTCSLPKRRPCPQAVGFCGKVVVQDPESTASSMHHLVVLSDLDESTLSSSTSTSSMHAPDTPSTMLDVTTPPKWDRNDHDDQEEPPKKKRKMSKRNLFLKKNLKEPPLCATPRQHANDKNNSSKATQTPLSRKNKALFPVLQANKNLPPQSRLAMPDDPNELNSLHCFVRSNLLELFTMTEEETGGVKQATTTPTSSPCHQRRVGLRCVYCGKLPRKHNVKNTMSVFFPKSLQDLYRLVCTWQRVHFKTCPYVPDSVKEIYKGLKQEDKSRGKKQHWEESALRLGLCNVNKERQGIVWKKDLL